ncbi:MAG: hypothetical protein ABW198_10035 [Pseudorhodoplanes sp.]
MKFLPAAFLIAVCAANPAFAADEFKIEPVVSLASIPVAQLKPRTIVFSETRLGEKAESPAELIPFDEWARDKPLQRRFLAMLPDFREPLRKEGGVDKLQIYVAEARFRVAKPAQAFDLKRYASIAFLEALDPAVKHKPITVSDIQVNKDVLSANMRPMNRKWCEDAAGCYQSRYRFEGRIPTGILLVNKLRDETKKPIPDFIEFQSEVRLPSPQDPQFVDIRSLTGLDAPVSGVFEETIFWVNQVIHSGKILAVMQQDPADAKASIATIYIALTLRSDVLNKQRNFSNAPILRNLVPVQLLMGRSSFNSGDSISSGLPNYARGRVKAIAAAMEKE